MDRRRRRPRKEAGGPPGRRLCRGGCVVFSWAQPGAPESPQRQGATLRQLRRIPPAGSPWGATIVEPEPAVRSESRQGQGGAGCITP